MNKALVIITGSSSGIGAAMVNVFVKEGYCVGMISRRDLADDTLALEGCMHCSADISNYDEFKSAVETIQNKFGPVECLINNAGYVKAGLFEEIERDDNQRMIDVNLLGVINGINIVLPEMIARKKGTIINISSLADRNSRPQIATYAATKAAVKSLSESLRMANAKHGIRVSNLAPAKVDSPMLLDGNFDKKDAINPEDVANAALWVFLQPLNICIRDLVIAPTGYEP